MAKKNKKELQLNSFILLDRSGSMQGRWDEAINAINVYASEIGIGTITVATFDDMGGLCYDVIRNAVPAKEFEPISPKEITPRGGTPLYDALFRTLVIAEAANGEKTSVIVMTDGDENQSREVSRQTVEKMIAKFKAKIWDVVFLGADFNAFGQSASVGVAAGQTLNMTAGNYHHAARGLVDRSIAYSATMDSCDAAAALGDFNDGLRAKAAGTSTPKGTK